MFYPVLLVAGLAGLVAMALLGFVHAPPLHKHGSPAPHAPLPAGGHHAPLPHHTPAIHHGHAPAAAAPAPAGAPLANPGASVRVSVISRGVTWLAPLISPLTWFSWMFGAGAAGTIAATAGSGEALALGAAAAGAIGFQLGVVRPVWNLVFRFESRPAGNLDACLLQEVEAITSFNARGEGLVRVVVDGHSADVLARLVEAERGRDSRPKRGDRLVIQEVDSRSNTCLVSRA